MKIFCQKCGNELREGVIICPECGFENKVAKRSKKKFLILISVAFVSITSGLLSVLYINGELKVSEDVNNAIRSFVGAKEYSGKDLIEGSLQQRNEGAYNWEAYIEDERDGKKYRIVKMPDDKWWMAENINYQKGLVMNERADFANGKKIINTEDGTYGIGSFWCNDSLKEWSEYLLNDYSNLDYSAQMNLRNSYGYKPTLEELKERYPGAKGSRNELARIDACAIYGALYTWETAVQKDGIGSWNTNNDNSHNICPLGWRLPTDGEWGTLLNSIEYETNGTTNHNTVHYDFAGQNSGRLLKSTNLSEEDLNDGTIWRDLSFLDSGIFGRGRVEDVRKQYVNLDYYGFSVLPVGLKTENVFFWKTRAAYFWTSTEDNSKDAKFRSFQSEEPRVFTGQHAKARAMSVRCIKDN